MQRQILWVAGIDPGIKLPALALVTYPHAQIVRAVTFPEETKMSSQPMPRRAQEVGIRIADLFATTEHHTVAVFIEDAAYNAKYQSESVAMARQSIYGALSNRFDVELIPIQKAKLALVGNGNAPKAQVANMAEKLLPSALASKWKKWNEATRFAVADAIAIAHGGVSALKTKRLEARHAASQAREEEQGQQGEAPAAQAQEAPAEVKEGVTPPEVE